MKSLLLLLLGLLMAPGCPEQGGDESPEPFNPTPIQEIVIDTVREIDFEPIQEVVVSQTLTLHTEPSWCPPCRRLERDGVIDELLAAGWSIEIRGAEGQTVPRFVMKNGPYQEQKIGYNGKARLYEWVRRATERSRQAR